MILHLANYAHLRRPAKTPRAKATVTNLADYRLSFSRGWLRYGPYYRRLTPEQSGDLSECLYYVLTTSTPGHPSVGEPAPGLIVTGEHPSVSIQGFGPPLRGEELHCLIVELRRFYMRRARRAR